MNSKLAAAIVMIALLGIPAVAHRLDEYLQAAMITVETNRIQVLLRLIPGVAVSSEVIASMDGNRDGVLSDTEERAYVRRVLSELSLRSDGDRLELQVRSMKFPTIEEMKEGLGEIQLELSASVPRVEHAERRLVFENHYASGMSAYLVNCLRSQDRNIRIEAQNRNRDQSFYELRYVQGASESAGFSTGDDWFSGFRSFFRLGMRHIAGGTDHLLFLLALLLPAPLLSFESRWSEVASVRHSLQQILKIVTAFTVGHSITLALAALAVVHVPSRPVEVLIAISILVSAVHALRPLFPGRETAIAGFFGLVHGLAFATTLGDLGVDRWERVASILAFNLGIETIQLVVVAATMPSLVLLSRTPAYSALRTGGALFAGMAALGWTLERTFEVHSSLDALVESFARHATWIATGLFVVSVICWSGRGAKLTSIRRAYEAS